LKRYWGYNSQVVKILVTQNAEPKVGVILLFIGFGFPVWNLPWPMRFRGFAVVKKGIGIEAIICILIFIGSHFTKRRISSKKNFVKSSVDGSPRCS
jgi:hypothetical protein